MKRAPRSRQRHDLYAKYHDCDSEISDLLGECGMVTFINRGTMMEDQQIAGIPSFASVRLDPDALAQARAVAPGWDVYVLESEWRSWMADGGLDAPKDPSKAFLGFCKKWFERRGRP